jgi:hypothetical protein
MSRLQAVYGSENAPRSIHSMSSSSSSSTLIVPSYLNQSYSIHESLQETHQVMRQTSYIGPRIHTVSQDQHHTHDQSDPNNPSHEQTIAKVGPIAYFSRFNRSILMTRSVGDRFGPRNCISIPEITALNVPNTVYMR